MHFTSPERAVQSRTISDIDWGKCFICQSDSNEKLSCAVNATRVDAQACYSGLADRIKKYKTLSELPLNMNLECLEAGYDLGQSLFINKAKHHKKCKEMFSNLKLERMEKSSSTGSNMQTPEVDVPLTRSSGIYYYIYRTNSAVSFNTVAIQ